MLLIYGVVDVFDQLGNDFVDAVVLVGRFFGWAGNNERGTRFVDQDGVDFVHDGELMSALYAVSYVVLHVVAQVVEAVFVVGAVGDVGAVGSAPLVVVEVVDDDADGEAEPAIKRTHPLGVAAGEVVVDGDDVNAAAGEGIQDSGKSGDEGLPFTGFHFGDFAVVQNTSADQLHVEVPHVEEPPAGFAGESERRNDGRFEGDLEFFPVCGFRRIGVF